MGYSDGAFTPATGSITAKPKDIIHSAVWNDTYGTFSTALTNIGQGVTLEMIVFNGPQSVTAGIKGFIEIPFNLSVLSWKIMAEQAGSVSLDLWNCPFNSFPPIAANSIVGGNYPTLSSAQSSSSSTLTGWSPNLSAGSILALVINDSSVIHQITVSLTCGRN